MIVFTQYTAISRSYAEIGELDLFASELAGTPFQSHSAFLHAIHSIRSAQRPLNILLDDQNRCTFVVNARLRFVDIAIHDRRETAAELGTEQKSRISHHRPSDRQHLLLTARERRRHVKAPLRQTRKERLHSCECPWARTATVRAHTEIVLHIKRRE